MIVEDWSMDKYLHPADARLEAWLPPAAKPYQSYSRVEEGQAGYVCKACQVGGKGPEDEQHCWCCGSRDVVQVDQTDWNRVLKVHASGGTFTNWLRRQSLQAQRRFGAAES